MEIIKELVNYGALGALLIWFMWRMEPRLKELAEAIHRSAEATSRAINRQSELLLLVIADQTADRKPGPGSQGRGSALEQLLSRLAREIARDLEQSAERAASGRKGV